jgi:para-nitrobenzyl esterase
MAEAVAHTSFGTVHGLERHGVLSFRGIPFAATTAGAGRWQAPAAIDLSGDLDATEFGPSAPQNAGGLEAMLGGGEQSHGEDCLRLNVFTPGADGAGRPVMIWIHGGGFETGSGHVPWYNGTQLARRGVVVVTINYRLGAFGFLHLGGLGLAGFDDAGNAGTLDQIAALRWVQANIRSFGGDPDNVTVFGESAGAMSIGTLLGAPAARGLFHKAILESGAADNIHSVEQATRVAERFVEAAGTGADVERLLGLSIAEVLAAQAKTGGASIGGELALPWSPMVDGTNLPVAPNDAVARGAAADVAMLAGTTLEEMRLFQMSIPALQGMDDERLGRWFSRPLGDRPDPAAAAAHAIDVYRGRLGSAATADEVWVAAATDVVFRMPAVRLAERQARHQPNTWMYLFTYASPAFGGMLGSCHALEVPFVFDNLGLNGVPMFVGPVEEQHRALAGAMADAWVAFARSGTPAAAGLPAWPAYEAGRRATMRLDVGLCEVVDDPMGGERELWSTAEV